MNQRFAPLAVCIAAAFAAWAPQGDARVTKIVVDRVQALAGQPIAYETLTGRAFGELDPNDPHNAEITDLRLATPNANGKVPYVATFHIVKPVNLGESSGLMWHDVPNRIGRAHVRTPVT